jgi:hypothetical protein
MELRSFPNEVVNVAGNVLVIVKLAWDVGIKAKGITIVSEENGVAIILQFAMKCSSLQEHLENINSKMSTQRK